MTREQAQVIAEAVVDALPPGDADRLKALDVCPKLHQGMLTIRVYFTNKTAEDPEPYIFKAEEIM